MTKSRDGGKILAEALQAHAVKKIFAGAEKKFLLADGLRMICCDSASAALMAHAYGQLTGHPGVCCVHRGPGACHVAAGVHAAMQDSTPLVLLAAQVARGKMGRESFQEIDIRLMFQPPIAKWAVQVDRAADIPRLVRDAFEAATSGRPGPVVIALPEDVLREEADASVLYPQEPLRFAPAHGDMERLHAMLRGAQRPLVIAGGSGWTAEAATRFGDFCGRALLPVAASFRRQDIFSNDHDCYVGPLGLSPDPQLAAAVKEADVIIALGTRLDDISMQGYTLLTPPWPHQRLVHIYPDSSELNRVYQAELAIHSGAPAFAAALANAEIDGSARSAWTQDLRQRYVKWSAIRSRDKFNVDLDGVMEDIIGALPEDAIITADIGRFYSWLERYMKLRRPLRLLAPGSGTGGYGVPAAIAASLACPDRPAICLTDKENFLKTGQALMEAQQEGAHPVMLVFDDTGGNRPGMEAFARCYGVELAAVAATDDFKPAFTAALASKKISIIDVKADRNQFITGMPSPDAEHLGAI